jgi:hypothetical protein
MLTEWNKYTVTCGNKSPEKKYGNQCAQSRVVGCLICLAHAVANCFEI